MEPRKRYKTVIVITGGTATGKTAAAIRLAQKLGTRIISADSRQCFKELSIGVARPSEEELQQVQHYFIASHSIRDEVNAALFEELALEWVDDLFRESDRVVMVGGTGLYINAFCEGLDAIPPVDPQIRQQLTGQYGAGGLAWLQGQVKKEDPDYYAVGETLNPRRLLRALEVKLSSGQSILSFQSREKKQRPFNIIKVGLDLPRETLNHNIHQRVDRMMDMGLLEEVRALEPYKALNALRTVGYTELFDHLQGKCSLEEAVAAIKTNTRHYAKRQLTWFRKDPSIQWIHPEDLEGLEKITQS